MTVVQQQWVAGTGAIAHSGNLSSVPFAELLVGLLDASATGTLRVHDARGSLIAVISFETGAPVAANLARPESTLNASLIPLCARSEGTFAFQSQRDELAGLTTVVRGRVDPLTVITAAMRGPTREDAVQRALNELRGCLLKLSPRADIGRYGFTADEASAAGLLREQPIPLAELEIQADLPLHALRRLVYVLAITRALSALPMASRAASGTIAHAPPPPPEERDRAPTVEFRRVAAELPPPPFAPAAAAAAPAQQRTPSDSGALRRPSGNMPRSTSGVGRYHVQRPIDAQTELPAEAVELGLPRDLPPALVLWRDEILARVNAIERNSYYELLDLPTDADPSEIDRAFTTLEKRFDPRVLPSELAAVSEQAQLLCDHLRQAHATLSDLEQRTEYDSELVAGGSSAKKHAHSRQIDAEAHYRKAEALLKRNDYQGALREVERAMAEGDSSARYDALYGWLLHLRSGSTDRVHPRALEHIDRALKLDPLCEQAVFYKAVLLKQKGEHIEARLWLKRVLKLNPEHAQAARELRLYDLRGQSSEGAGILNRLFGKRG